MTVDERALRYLERNGTTSVQGLYDALKSSDLSLNKAEVTDMLWRLVEQGEVTLDDAPLATKSLIQFLTLWERNLWLLGSLLISFATIFVVYAPPEFPFAALRWILGSVFILFIPGYVTVQALFPRGIELNSIERFALSIGLSLALAPLVGLLLNFTPLGIKLTPVMISLIILTLIVTVIAVARRYRISAEGGNLERSREQY